MKFSDFMAKFPVKSSSVTVNGITIKVDGDKNSINEIVNAGSFDIFQRDKNGTRIPVSGFKTRKLSGAAGRAAAKKLLEGTSHGPKNPNG